MILELIAAVSAGFALFGVTLLANVLTGRRMARWAYPAAFAAGMLGYAVWAEYSWAERTTGPLSPYVVAEAVTERSWYRPWTWAFPLTTRLTVLDRRFTRTHPDQPDLVLVRVVRLARYVPDSGVLAVFDCAANAVAPMVEGVEMLPDGTLEGADWAGLPEGDPVLTRACALREEIADVRGQGS